MGKIKRTIAKGGKTTASGSKLGRMTTSGGKTVLRNSVATAKQIKRRGIKQAAATHKAVGKPSKQKKQS